MPIEPTLNHHEVIPQTTIVDDIYQRSGLPQIPIKTRTSWNAKRFGRFTNKKTLPTSAHVFDVNSVQTCIYNLISGCWFGTYIISPFSWECHHPVFFRVGWNHQLENEIPESPIKLPASTSIFLSFSYGFLWFSMVAVYFLAENWPPFDMWPIWRIHHPRLQYTLKLCTYLYT